MYIVERYYAPISRAFNIVRKEAPNLEKKEALQMAVKAIVVSVDPDGLASTLLVFGALTRLCLLTDSLTS